MSLRSQAPPPRLQVRHPQASNDSRLSTSDFGPHARIRGRPACAPDLRHIAAFAAAVVLLPDDPSGGWRWNCGYCSARCRRPALSLSW